jgi:hypothetical protein
VTDEFYQHSTISPIDATACYDRIIPGLGNLASRSHGLNRTIAIVQGKTLSDVRYHLKTQLGVTDEFYQHSTISPIYGTGQGSGNSPTVWLVFSSILFRCYSATAHGARFESPDGTVAIDLYRVGFVDDTCSYVNQFLAHTIPTLQELISLLSHDSQLWCDLLWKLGLIVSTSSLPTADRIYRARESAQQSS